MKPAGENAARIQTWRDAKWDRVVLAGGLCDQSKCFHFASALALSYNALVKTKKKIPLTVRRCPAEVHEALKASAAANHRSLNGEALTWLEKQAEVQKPVTARELADALRN
jgi:hypothetical protein